MIDSVVVVIHQVHRVSHTAHGHAAHGQIVSLIRPANHTATQLKVCTVEQATEQTVFESQAANGATIVEGTEHTTLIDHTIGLGCMDVDQ